MTSANVIEYDILKGSKTVGHHHQNVMCLEKWEKLFEFKPLHKHKICPYGYDEEEEMWYGDEENLLDFLYEKALTSKKLKPLFNEYQRSRLESLSEKEDKIKELVFLATNNTAIDIKTTFHKEYGESDELTRSFIKITFNLDDKTHQLFIYDNLNCELKSIDLINGLKKFPM